MASTIRIYAGSYRYDFPTIVNFGTSFEVPFSRLALPGQDATSTVLFSLSGSAKKYSITWQAINTGSDLSGGTAPDPPFTSNEVITVDDQLEYLESYFMKDGVNTTFLFWHPRLTSSLATRIGGIVESIDFSEAGGDDATVKDCIMVFAVGDPTTV